MNEYLRACLIGPTDSIAFSLIGPLCVIAMLAMACSSPPAEDISSIPPYSEMISRRYSIVSDTLDAYGIDSSLDDHPYTADYVLLVPRPGIGGVEVAFKRNVPKGTILRIVSAWKRPIPFGKELFYIVEFENWDLPPGTLTRLSLSMEGAGGGGAELNPAIYERLAE